MAEKVPSFKHGGAYWFTDLTTPDALYVFPVLAALSFLITVEVSIFFHKLSTLVIILSRLTFVIHDYMLF